MSRPSPSMSLKIGDFSVRLSKVESTFVALPAAYCEALLGDFPVILSLSWGEKRLNVAWMGETIQKNYGDLSIEIPHALGTAAGLIEGMLVSATTLNHVPPAAKVVLKVIGSIASYEQVAAESELLENTLLQQISVVTKGQTLPLHIRHSSVKLLVEEVEVSSEISTEPTPETALCVNKTELIVLPPDGSMNDTPNSEEDKFEPWHLVLRVQTEDTLCSSLSDCDIAREALSDLASAVYVSDDSGSYPDFLNGSLVAIEAHTKATSYMDVLASSEEPNYKPTVIARIFTKHLPPIMGKDSTQIPLSISKSHVYLPKQIRDILQVKQGNRVVLIRRKPETIGANALYLRWSRQIGGFGNFDTGSSKGTDILERWIQNQIDLGGFPENTRVPVRDMTLLSKKDNLIAKVEYGWGLVPGAPINDDNGIIRAFEVERAQIPEQNPFELEGVQESSLEKSNPSGGLHSSISIETLHHMREMTNEVILNLFSQAQGVSGGALLRGNRGSGKTLLASTIEKAMMSLYEKKHYGPLLVLRVSCSVLHHRLGPGMVWDTLRQTFLEARQRSPALVVLDDLDEIVGIGDEDDESVMAEGGNDSMGGQNAADPLGQERAIAFVTADLLSEEIESSRCEHSQLLVLSTSKPGSVFPSCIRGPGRLIDMEKLIHAPEEKVRSSIFLQALQSVGCEGSPAAAAAVALSSRGYEPKDLAMAAARAAHIAIARGSNKVEVDDVNRALDGCVALGMEGALSFGTNGQGENEAQSSPNTPAGIDSVGGYIDLKRELLEALALPLQKLHGGPPPIRLRSGVLLYGFPGCGKTFTLTAVTKSIGARLVMVKGPEVLGKYIGSSEAAVRRVFARARAAAPCVLFLDEVDAIAPRRGQAGDSTGVTDRVVNQLLTEMDGIKPLTGVAVVAATSRPDMLDPALLRPAMEVGYQAGRLDRHIFVDLPNDFDRVSILQLLCKDLDEYINHDQGTESLVAQVATLTPGYSGADLRAVISEAFMISARKALKYSNANGAVDEEPLSMSGLSLQNLVPEDNSNQERLHVGISELLEAIKAQGPSVHGQDLAGYKEEYAVFSGKKSGTSNVNNLMGKQGKRVILA